jgi:hypothetical protein
VDKSGLSRDTIRFYEKQGLIEIGSRLLRMRQISYISVVKLIASIFLCLVAFFTVQPLISSRGMLAGEQAIAPAMHCCAKMMKCPKKSRPASNGSNRGKCDENGCNPFMACAYGNFYLPAKGGLIFFMIAPEKEKKIALNDNRLSSSLSESWHPPERILPVS